MIWESLRFLARHKKQNHNRLHLESSVDLIENISPVRNAESSRAKFMRIARFFQAYDALEEDLKAFQPRTHNASTLLTSQKFHHMEM